MGGEDSNGKLYGRGASDMKSGFAAITMALDAVLKAGLTPKDDIFLEYTVDEELSGNGTLACIIRGYQADAGICCETSSLHVQPGCIGRIWFEIQIKGKPAGIQCRFEGVSAIEKGYIVAKAVSNLEAIRIHELRHPLYPDNLSSLPCMVTQFDSGTFPSAFHNTCTLKGSIASCPGKRPGGRTPTVISGPGPTEQMHATNEWIGVDDLIVATKTLALTIGEWCGVEEDC